MYYALSFLAGAIVATAGCWIFLVRAMKEIEVIVDDAQSTIGHDGAAARLPAETGLSPLAAEIRA
jgi:hypothetical protein